MSFIIFYQQEIKRHPLFNHMSDDCFDIIMQHSGLLSLKKNKLLFANNDEASKFYMVRSGQMALFQMSLNGKEKIIDIHDPGQTFAESILFSGDEYYSLNARAILDTQLFYFDAQIFRNQLHKSTQLCFSMMTELSSRLTTKTEEIIDLSIYDAQYRLVKYLLRKSCKDSQNPCQPIIILSTTKTMLASRLSITSETFSRVLAKLKKQGLITIEHETITLNEPQKLRRLIGCHETKLSETDKIRSY